MSTEKKGLWGGNLNEAEIVKKTMDAEIDDLISEAAKKSAGLKFDTGKPPMSLLSSIWLWAVSDVLAFGAKKYASHNWRKGIQYSRLTDAAMRHITAFNDGEDLDPETKLSHLAHASCCLMFLTELHARPPKGLDEWKGSLPLDDRFQYRELYAKKHDQDKLGIVYCDKCDTRYYSVLSEGDTPTTPCPVCHSTKDSFTEQVRSNDEKIVKHTGVKRVPIR